MTAPVAWTSPIDLAQDCREAAESLAAVADLCIPASNDPFDTARSVTAAQVGPVFEILVRTLLSRLDALDQALARG